MTATLGARGDAPGTEYAIEAENLTVGYNGVPVVHGVDLQIRHGRVTVLLGANGAGKTTTLMALTRALPSSSGTVRVGGEEVTSLRCHQVVRRGVRLVPEDRGLVAELTAGENLRLHGCARRRRGEVLEVFPALKPLMGRRAGLLSGGEQQMLALACAISSNPRVLLIDELSHGLAPIIVERLLPTVRRLAEERAMAVLLVEQHVNAALAVASDVYVLKRGRIVLSGEAGDVGRDRALLEASYLGDAEADTFGESHP